MSCLVRARATIALGFAAALPPSPAPAGAQALERAITDRPSCAACRIELRRVATLGTEPDGGIGLEPIAVTRDARGRLYVTVQPPGDLVLVFDERGRFVKRLGRKGKGPNEYEFPVQVTPARGGRLLVWEFGGRLSTLDAEHRFLFHSRVPWAPLFELPDGRRVVVSPRFDERGRLFPVHLVDDSGATVASLGDDSRRYDRQHELSHWRTVAPARDGGIWAAHRDRYAVDRIDRELRLAVRFTRGVSWHPVVTRPSAGVDGRPPTPMIAAVHEDSLGRLWVVSRVAAARWRDGLGAPRRSGGETVYPDRDPGRLHESMIDVIDWRRGRLVVSARVPHYVRWVFADGLVAAYRESADGEPLVDLLSLRLAEHSRRAATR